MSVIRHRPPRLRHIEPALLPFYFVTFNTHRRRPLLANKRIHAQFTDFAFKARKFGVSVGRYVLMPDHVHLFVVMPPADVTLPRWIQSLKAVIGKELLTLGHAKPHWQEGFFDHLMRSGESYAQKWAYVRENPVRAGLVASTEDWPYQGEIELIRF